MPEQEFEIYLSLLSRLLRLSPAQKAAISDELRDHLEQRLTELLQSGISRDEAIKRAMEEFGDVTGLALDLTKVSKTPLRKVVVRSTIAASAVAVAIVCWFTLFVPEHRIAGPLAVQAQQDKPAADPAKPSVAIPTVVAVDDELFPEFLTRQIDINFTETPLKDVCHFLESELDVPILPNRLALQDNGMSLDTPITLELKGLTFEEVLNHVTRPLHLTWQADGDMVRITTQDYVGQLNRQFDLSKLTKRGHTPESLVAIVRLGGDGDWESEGWQAVLIGETVVVRQTYQNQRRIARLLAAIESPQPLLALEPCTGRDRLRQALQEPSSVEFEETPLKDAIRFLSESHQVSFQLDLTIMNDEGIAEDIPVTLSLKNRPLGKLLDILLADAGLSHIMRDGVILVTSRSRAEEDLTWYAYNVHDLAPTEELLIQLSEVIERTISGKWMQFNDEGGELARTEVGGCLLIKQSDKSHAEIQSLLARLRQSQKGRAGEPAKPAPGPKLVSRYYRMPHEIAADLSKALPSIVATAQWAPVNGELPRIELVASAPLMETVDGSVSGGTHEIRILNPTPEKPSGTGKPEPAGRHPATQTQQVQSIVVRPRSTLIIRQTPQVHRDIDKFLQNVGINYEPGNLQGGGFGGGMGGGGFFGGMGGGMGGNSF